MINLTSRLRAAAFAACVHFGFSVVVAIICAAVVFGLWYPYPYRELSGGLALFILIVAVDVVCGPLLTAVIFNPVKTRKELVRDLTLVALIQLVALAYGVYTMAQARPVYMVFEVDRFNVISAVDVDEAELAKVAKQWGTLPIWGPQVIGSREPKDADERTKSLGMSLQGVEPSMRPDWWQNLELSSAKILERAKPVAELRKLHAAKPAMLQKIEAAVKDTGKAETDLRWLPLTSQRDKDWVVLLDARAGVPLAYAPVDGF
jgi:hypothetical protein